jgi:cell wall assembly regulator SMI1
MKPVASAWRPKIIKPQKVASDAVLDDAEAELGVKLPADYRAIVKLHQGAVPTVCGVPLPNGDLDVFNALYHFEQESMSQVPTRARHLAAMTARKLVPIGETPGGDLFCFDYTHAPDAPPIVIWTHDDPDVDVVPVAASFTELVDRLTDG